MDLDSVKRGPKIYFALNCSQRANMLKSSRNREKGDPKHKKGT